MRVLGAAEEEDPPGLSDSGDEASWEDEDDADLPHAEQQTPCLFCDRFVHLSARLWPSVAEPRGFSWSVQLESVTRVAALEMWNPCLGVRVCPEGGAMNCKSGYSIGLRRPLVSPCVKSVLDWICGSLVWLSPKTLKKKKKTC